MKILLNPSFDPAYNLALEELLASEYPEEALMLWRNAPAIIVGCNQNTEAEINAETVRKLGIPVIRRITGGGAVYHDTGNINYTIVANDRQLEAEAFARNASVIIKVLEKMGLEAGFFGRNDILLDGRKISGSAKSVLKNRTLFHGTLLFDAELSVLSQVLTPDVDKIRAKGIKSVRSRVANIREYLPMWDEDEFLCHLSSGLRKELGEGEFTPIPEELSIKASKLAVDKYRSWEWNYGSRMPYNYRQKGRFSSGSVEIAFNVSDNRICDLNISGDFFGRLPVTELAEKLNGTLSRFDNIAGKVAAIDIDEYISGMSVNEFMTLFRLS
ncbi:MAG: lipoate--protein ligase [Lentisphaeria bacterium]|nr:lipoate--protein ligase [Lentisphaeria bacterium]